MCCRAREDIPSADRVATLVQDVETTRREKMQRGVNSVLRSAATEATPSMIDLTNASAMEVNALRSTFCKVCLSASASASASACARGHGMDTFSPPAMSCGLARAAAHTTTILQALDYIVEAGEMDREASRRAAAQARSARMLAGVAGAVPLGDGSTPGNPRSLSSSATPGTEGRTRTRIIGSPVRAPDFDADTGMGGAAADGVADDDEEYGAGGAAQPPGAKLRRFR
ncbi:hypothetical protein EON66_01050 [archaeon]|nr:MAG: hypothetical protein EON66_01050 [archaeon]